MDYNLEEIRPRIFLFSMPDKYNLNMHFLRYQEFYESTSRQFRGKSFKLLDFMAWYSKKYGKGNFTYTTDWDGFNIPGSVLKQVMDAGIQDKNSYDQAMENVYWSCKYKHDGDFYLIGARDSDNKRILKHEIAHGFFYLNADYRASMTAFVKALPVPLSDMLKSELKRMGYTPKVYIDELQAYLSTGLPSNMKPLVPTKEQKPFVKLFNKYYKL